MKKSKKIFALLFVITLLLNVASVSAVTSEDAEFNAVLREQGKSNLLYTAILNSYRQDGECIYPEYYAGAYANEKGKIIVKVTALTDDVKKEIIKAAGSDDIIFEETEYSYNYLLALKDEISGYRSENAEKSKTAANITSVGIYDDKNVVFVELLENTPDNAAVLMNEVYQKREAGTLPIMFEQGEIIERTVVAHSGSQIRKNITIPGPSVGFPVQIKSQVTGVWNNAFVTCGHHGYAEGDMIRVDNNSGGWTAIGTLVLNVFQHNTPYDYGVVVFDSGHSHSRTVVHSNGITYSLSGYTDALVGTSVYKRGRATGVTFGTVAATNTDYKDNNNIVTKNTTRVSNMSAADGDSGGLVYTFVYIGYTDRVYTAGIILGGTTYSYYMPASTIINHTQAADIRYH